MIDGCLEEGCCSEMVEVQRFIGEVVLRERSRLCISSMAELKLAANDMNAGRKRYVLRIMLDVEG